MRRVVRTPADLQRECSRAEPGDTILIHGGFYAQPAKLMNKGTPDDPPIVFKAADDEWITGAQSPNPFWGGGDPATSPPTKPGVDDFAFLIIDKCARVVIEGLKIKNCWPSIFFIKDSSHLTIRDCVLRHGTYAIFAKGSETSHLLIEGNEWQQDDTRRLWTEIDWARAHGAEGSDGIFRYFNGGFLSTKGVRGRIVVRGNCIKDAYNGVRMKADTDSSTENTDVHIVGNDFIRIRDNPIEPEVAAHNWQVRHNRLMDCHSSFSVDGVRGGHWYIYGNSGSFQTRQGKVGEFTHTMGRVLKLSYEASPASGGSDDTPESPWFVFNNSWNLRCPIVGGASPALPEVGEGPDFTKHLGFFNNAFTWCDPGRDGEWVCELIELMRFFSFEKSPGTSFDYSICDRPDYLVYMRHCGRGEANGLLARRPIFDDGPAGLFTLPPDSEARNTGRTDWPGQGPSAALRLQVNGKLNRGAHQDYGLISVPDLEAQTTALVAEIAGTGASARKPVRRAKLL